jgi:hypothetical protein
MTIHQLRGTVNYCSSRKKQLITGCNAIIWRSKGNNSKRRKATRVFGELTLGYSAYR